MIGFINVEAPSYWDTPFAQPYFDNTTKRDLTATVGQVALLRCRVRNLGDRAVCISTRIYIKIGISVDTFIYLIYYIYLQNFGPTFYPQLPLPTQQSPAKFNFLLAPPNEGNDCGDVPLRLCMFFFPSKLFNLKLH